MFFNFGFCFFYLFNKVAQQVWQLLPEALSKPCGELGRIFVVLQKLGVVPGPAIIYHKLKCF